MFKKKCPKCNNNVSKSHDFCPTCGTSLRTPKQSNPEAWGMLGKDDVVSQPQNSPNPLAGGFLKGGLLNKMLGSAMKMLEKELQKEMKNPNNLNNLDQIDNPLQPKTDFQLFINGKKVNITGPGKKRIIVRKANNQKDNSKKSSPKKKLKEIKIPTRKLNNFSKLPKETPETTIRRLSESIIYEIEMPGIKSKKDISITKLENNIEIKAVTKNKAYYKVIKVDLPIIEYSLDKETLILELAEK